MKTARKPKKISTKRLDGLWSKAVKEEAKGLCEYCGQQGHNSHHVFGRRNFAVRWDLDNGVYLCYAHHQFSNEFSAHQTPTRFTDWIIHERGEAWYKDLNDRAQKIWDKDKEKALNLLLESTK